MCCRVFYFLLLFLFNRNAQKMVDESSSKELLTISSRHWIVPRDASTISSDRLSTRVWAFVLIKDEMASLIKIYQGQF